MLADQISQHLAQMPTQKCVAYSFAVDAELPALHLSALLPTEPAQIVLGVQPHRVSPTQQQEAREQGMRVWEWGEFMAGDWQRTFASLLQELSARDQPWQLVCDASCVARDCTVGFSARELRALFQLAGQYGVIDRLVFTNFDDFPQLAAELIWYASDQG